MGPHGGRPSQRARTRRPCRPLHTSLTHNPTPDKPDCSVRASTTRRAITVPDGHAALPAVGREMCATCGDEVLSAGTEIHHAVDCIEDSAWAQRISQAWDRDAVLAAMGQLQEHIKLQDLDHQSRFKVSYLLRASNGGLIGLARQCLRRHGLQAEPQLRCHWFLDVLPQRASRSEAIRFLAQSWGLSLEQVLVVASQQGDGELLDGLPATVVPADHDPCLLGRLTQQRVYLSKRSSVEAVLDGIDHYKFKTKL